MGSGAYVKRVRGQVAAIELRSLLVTDAPIPLNRRETLVRCVSTLIADPDAARAFQRQLTWLIQGRFGRNPDSFQVSEATLAALRLVEATQLGERRKITKGY
jgi:hypothetical protein